MGCWLIREERMIVVKGCSLEGCPVIRGRVLLRDEGEGASEERKYVEPS